MTEQRQPNEEELRAAYEEQLRSVRVEEILVQTVLSLLNVGSLRAGLVPGYEGERDLAQLRQAIEGARALMALVEGAIGPDSRQLRDALSSLQMAYARAAGEASPGAEQAGAAGAEQPGAGRAQQPAAEGAEQAPPAEPEQPKPGEPGPAQRSGRLWVPGQ
jgi:hypothetical protein